MSDELRVEYVELDALARAPRNPKRHELGTLQASLGRFGFVAPIVLDEATGRLVVGHGRLDALKQLKAAGGAAPERVRVVGDRWLVPVVRGVAFASPIEAESYLVADNQTTIAGGWDSARLAELLGELEGQDALAGTGFNAADVDALLREIGQAPPLAEAPAARVDRAADLYAKWETRPGQLWEIGPHRLLCGDSTERGEVDRLLAGERVDVVFTDPPYGVNVTGAGGDPIAGDISFTAIPLMFDMLDRVLSDGAWCYVCGGQSNMLLYSRMFERYFRQLPRVIVWDKGRTAVLRHNGYHSCYELIYFTFREGGGGRWFAPRDSDHADDIWRIGAPSGADRTHVTEKPVELPARAIANSCPPRGLVFDPFAGAGSTLIAAEQCGRRSCAIEIEPKYIAVILERLSEMGLQPRLG